MKAKNSLPTMKDVAKEAGVALGTVSNVINNLPVGDEYKKRVDAAVKKLGYKINNYAKGLKSNKTNTVAFIIPNTIHPFYASLTNAINLALLQKGYKMFLCCTDFDKHQEQDFIEMVQRNRVDGIIGLTYNPKLSVPSDISFVSIDRVLSPNISCVSSDNFGGGSIAAHKLAELGCKRVAFLRTGSSLNNEPNKRRAGFENGCMECGLSYDLKIIGDEAPVDAFFDFLKEHYHNGKLDYDGLFCVTDILALKVIKMLKQLKLSVPEDVQVIGFDGIKSYIDGRYHCSTIVQSVEKIAQTSVSILLQDPSEIKYPIIYIPVEFGQGNTTSH